MRLAEVLHEVPARVAAGPSGVDIRGIADHSRQVEPGFLFAAVEGHRESGSAYLEEAIRRGARAVLSRRPPGPVPPGCAWVRAEDERLALAGAARNFHRRPDEAIRVVGITGTNGKTTVSYLLEAILAGGGRSAARIGTVDYRYGGTTAPAGRTTPSPVDLFRMLAAAREGGDGFAVVEVSSHALDQKRVAGLRFAAAVFTNLSRDHLDYHGDMEAYFAAKRRLFESLPEGSPAVVNRDDPAGARIASGHRGRIVTFGFGPDAWCRPEEWRTDRDGIRARLRLGEDGIEVTSPLLGRVNLANLLAAAAAAAAVGCSPGGIAAGIARVRTVPGRLERIDPGGGVVAIVDYAHSPDALAKLLETVRDLRPARLLCVFGCGGDRDRGKRAPMGRIGALGSDLAILTSDNPRSEDPRAILAEVERGAREAGGRTDRVEVIADRREAILAALDRARPGDAVVVAGKGHETVQEFADGSVPFDDREVVREWAAARAGSEPSYGAA
ncbi:MAG: UDP-N-acetylmuramoyl-L-alanyl-D-glutamate--2,6-diaminopimelate ligase [Acidobacteria bacterium]|nr:UDP-N-acetylmuramoyl-L-alanyl-D-glutamate--2,6-diaminopimelate ligase [Acidobacteriota bacterium]